VGHEGGNGEKSLASLILKTHHICLHHSIRPSHTALIYPTKAQLLLEKPGHLVELLHQVGILPELLPVVHQLLNLVPVTLLFEEENT